MKKIKFRDRQLKPNEKSHYYCEIYGEELHPCLLHTHKCIPIIPRTPKSLYGLNPEDISPYSLVGTGFDGKNISWN